MVSRAPLRNVVSLMLVAMGLVMLMAAWLDWADHCITLRNNLP